MQAVGGRAQTLGDVSVNMADILDVASTSTDGPLQLVLEPTRMSGVESAAVMVDLSWGFVKEGSPSDEDVMSTQSAESEINDDDTMDVSTVSESVGSYGEADDSPRDMRFAVFLQEDGEEELVVNGQPSWTLDEVRDAADEEMAGRGLWVFMQDGAPVDPEEEESILAGALNLNAEDEDDDAQGMMEEELRAELTKTKRDAKLLQTRVSSLERMLEAAGDGGGGSADAAMLQVLRAEIETMRTEHTEALSTKQDELDEKTRQWQQAMDIGQDLVEKNHELTEAIAEAKEETNRVQTDMEPLEAEVQTLKEIIADHEENAALIEEEREAMEEQRYRITELEGLRDMLEQDLREKDEAFEERMESELEEQKEELEKKHQADVEYEQQKTKEAMEKAASEAAQVHASEDEEMKELRAKITDLESEVQDVTKQFKMEQSFGSAHKNEIKKGQIAMADLKKEKKEMLEKLKGKDEAVKKIQTQVLAEEKKVHELSQKNQMLKKELHLEKSNVAACNRDLEHTRADLERKEAELMKVATPEDAPAAGGLIDMQQMTEMQEQIASEYKTKYEERIKGLQAKLADTSKKLKAAETKVKNARRGASSEELKAAMAAAAKKANESAEAKQKKMEARLAKKDAALKEQRRKAAMLSGKPAKQKQQKVEMKLEGFLMKKGNKGPIKKWQWRWFVYDTSKHRLDYYLKEDLKQKKVYKGYIDLVEPDCKVFVLPNDLQDKCRQSFGIHTGGKSPRVFYLMAGDRKMMTKWVGQLARECKAWQDNGGKKPQPVDPDDDAEEGVPPEKAAQLVDEMVAATTKANELLAQLSEGAPSAKLKQEAEAASDEQLASAKSAMKALDYAKATISLKLAIKLDPENMEAEKLMKQAMAKMAAMDGELKEGIEQQQKRAADSQKKKSAAKPLKKISMFDDDEEDDSDDGGGLFA